MTLRRYAWPILIGALAALGIMLALADIAVGDRWPNPMAQVIIGAKPHARLPATQTLRFDRTRVGDRLIFESPISGFGPLNPYEAIRAFLANGAGLTLLALAGLIAFPRRARSAVERFESVPGAAISFGAGLVLVLLTLGVVTLLRFTLLFLAVVPLVVAVALVAALFGVGCIALAIGRLIHERLHLPDVHPLIAALVGALVVFDLAVIPYVGIVAFAAIAMAGLGLTVITRFGSAGGWSFVDLDW
ncbi:MAG TPA: hypothetical protein VFR33_11455 [Candidatus Dormibacteraeota bacterium]|nr:hypothetical protein [Candidatus Dormibacteraeota bacterium]